jgi:hypothetical protein
MMIEYRPAFGYFFDTGTYLIAAARLVPDQTWPFGYSAFLRLLSPTGKTAVVPLAQHALGLLLALAIYTLLVRRGLSRRISVVAAAPVVLDSRQLMLEHFILSDALFSVLLMTGVLLLLWFERPPIGVVVGSAVFFVAAALTRTVGLGVLPIVVAYVVIRRLGAIATAAFVLALFVPFGGYVVWYHHHHGVYNFNQSTGRFLWSRTTTFVDCSASYLTDREHQICPVEPRGARGTPDNYLWNYDPTHLREVYPGVENDATYRTFALKAIRHQPMDYVATVLVDTGHFITPGWIAPVRTACVDDLWRIPSGPGICPPTLVADGFQPDSRGVGGGNPIDALNSGLREYGLTFTTPPVAVFLLAGFVVVTALRRPRTWRSHDLRDSVFLAGLGVGCIVVAMATSAIDYRYVLPTLPMLPAAAALAWNRLRTARLESATPAGGQAVEGVR